MAKKSALGKGLAALLGEEAVNKDSNDDIDEKSGTSGKLISQRNKDAHVYLDIDEVVPNDEQPRKIFDESTITELAQSIKEKGILQPIIVAKKNGKYMLVIGERRWRASKKAGLDKIPAFIKDYSDIEILEVALIENIQREDLNPIEEAAAFAHLIEKHNITHEKLSEKVGKSRAAITNKMRLLKLPDILQEDLVIGNLTEGHGRALLYLENEKKMEMLRQKIIDENLSVRETEALAKKWNDLNLKQIKKTQSSKNPAKTEGRKAPEVKDMEEKLSTIFGTKVIIQDKNNKGKIIIDYYSLEDFQRVLENINGVS